MTKFVEVIDQLSGWALSPEQRQAVFSIESKMLATEMSLSVKQKQIDSLTRSINVCQQTIQSQAAQMARLTQAVTNMGTEIGKLRAEVHTGKSDTSAYDLLVGQVIGLKEAMEAEMERCRQRETEADPVDEMLEAIAQLRGEVEALKNPPRRTTPRRATTKKQAPKAS